MSYSSTHARVQVTVEFYVGTWGEDCTQKQVWEQASRDAVAKITQNLSKERVRVIGEPTVTAILSQKES